MIRLPSLLASLEKRIFQIKKKNQWEYDYVTKCVKQHLTKGDPELTVKQRSKLHEILDKYPHTDRALRKPHMKNSRFGIRCKH